MASTTKHILVVGLGNYTHPGTRHNVGMMVVDSIARRFNVSWDKKNIWQAEVATATTTITMKKRKPAPPKVRTPSPAAKLNTPPVDAIVSEAEDLDSATTATETTNLTSTAPTPVVRKKEPVETTTLELKLTLLKPLQLMNVSGSSVSRAARDLGITPNNILVIHDDMERDIGKLSFKSEGSANGHNGIKSCVKSLGTQHFKRLRVGIGRPAVKERSSSFIASYVLGKFKPLEVEKLEELVYDKAGDEIIRVSTVDPIPKNGPGKKP